MKSLVPEMLLAALTQLKTREKVLPSNLLRAYVGSMLEKRRFLLESATRFGTPQYVFDEPAFGSTLEKFWSTFSRSVSRLRLFYALKSNSFSGLCKHVSATGHGLDVSSGYELSMALNAGCRDIVFSGPGKTDPELITALRNRDKVTLLMDSAGELERAARLAQTLGLGAEPAKAGIRIRGHHHGMWNKFGIPLPELGPLLQKAPSIPGLDLCGLQFHTSWNRGPGAQVEMIRAIGAYLKRNLSASAWERLKFLDIGGGYWPERGEWLNPRNTLWGRFGQVLDPHREFKLKHYYLPSRPLDHFAKEIAQAVALQGSPLSDLEIWVEPGRWLSTPAMHILLKVVDEKDEGIVVTDGGINLLGWERPLTEFIPVINLSQPSLKEIPTRVFGSLCTPLDIWGTSCFCQKISPGDILLIPDQGAYTYSLRQSFIKPIARVIQFDGKVCSEVEQEQGF
jgi:diaminopimelate decarboxylase